MDKKTALNHLGKTRETLHKTLNETGPSRMSDRSIEGKWTLKDVLGHITAWDLTLLHPLTKLASGGTFEPEEIPDGEKYNRQQAELRDQRVLSDVIDEMNQVRQKIIKSCEKLPEPAFERTYPAPWGGEDTLAGMIYGLAWHENEHLKPILKMKAESII